jgi:hypothetical protein
MIIKIQTLSKVEVFLFELNQSIEKLPIIVEKLLILVGNQQLKFLRELNLIDVHPNLNAFRVSLFVEVLIVAAEESEIEIGIIESVNGDLLFSIVLGCGCRYLPFTVICKTLPLLCQGFK